MAGDSKFLLIVHVPLYLVLYMVQYYMYPIRGKIIVIYSRSSNKKNPVSTWPNMIENKKKRKEIRS
jgi:nitrate reductase alpha subunit